jgi:predicted transposase YbfD/YdcC
MALTEAQARRAVRRAEVNWDQGVEDPRSDRNQRHSHHGILSLLMVGFATGRVHFRDVENLSEDLGAGTRRRLDLPRRVSDTTLYRTVATTKPSGFRETVQRQVHEQFEKKVVRNDLFRLGVVSFDGKCTWSSTRREVEGAKTSTEPSSGLVVSSLSALKAVLTSSGARPCLDMELIAEKTGESPAFREVFPRVCQSFGAKFQVVTGDAGLTCRENALLVRKAGKDFLLALKGNQPTLHAFAEKWFSTWPGTALKESREWRNGACITRTLYAVQGSDLPEMASYGVEELWCVRQVTQAVGENPIEETRYFLSSMAPKLLSPTEKLQLVRLHWGIENAHNWTLDVALAEDDVQPCQASKNAIEVVAWLRILAYNILSVWRAHAPKKDGKPMTWRRAMEQLRDALIALLVETRATLA